VNRLDIQPQDQVAGLPGLMSEITEGGARSKTKGALEGAKDKAKDVMSSITGRGDDEDEDDEDDGDERSSRREDRGVPASRRPRARR
jgi:hypothetical protein